MAKRTVHVHRIISIIASLGTATERSGQPDSVLPRTRGRELHYGLAWHRAIALRVLRPPSSVRNADLVLASTREDL
jgi:hypothetical protein